jgi:hypothetical protein
MGFQTELRLPLCYASGMEGKDELGGETMACAARALLSLLLSDSEEGFE